MKEKTEKQIIKKRCSKCRNILNISEFYKQKDKKDGYRANCKSCISIQQANKYQLDVNYRTASAIQSRRWFAENLYNITLEEYDAYIDVGSCGICGDTKRKLVLDHCHDTGKVRGALCQQCNSGIGQLGDNVQILERAILWLKKD